MDDKRLIFYEQRLTQERDLSLQEGMQFQGNRF